MKGGKKTKNKNKSMIIVWDKVKKQEKMYITHIFVIFTIKTHLYLGDFKGHTSVANKIPSADVLSPSLCKREITFQM